MLTIGIGINNCPSGLKDLAKDLFWEWASA